jgi:hypothetical protein
MTTDLETLEGFLNRVRAANPFLASRVDRPWAAGLIDVPGIHDAAFQQILALGRQARAEDRGIGVLVSGEAGVGKSHLLARLARWAREGPRACYVYLYNLQAGPERLPRYLLRSVVSVLATAAAPEQSRLFLLLDRVLRKALALLGLKRGSWQQIEQGFDRLLGHLAARDPSRGVLFDRAVYRVLFRFYQAAHPWQQGKEGRVVRLALAWLSGEVLDPDEARLLGLPGGESAPADNQQVKQVLVALTRLARLADQLFLLCLDQVDNLDEDQVHALSRFLHDLLDSAGNLLVATTGVRQTLLGFRQAGVITETSWDRLAQVELVLARIRPPRGRELLEARLRSFLGPFAGVPDVREQVGQDPLFPLGKEWFDGRAGRLTDFRPRDLLTWAAERWLGQQERLAAMTRAEWLGRWREGVPLPREPVPVSRPELLAAVDRAVAQMLAGQVQRRLQEPGSLPPSEEQMQGLTYRLLRRLGGGLRVEQVPERKHGKHPAYDLLVRARPAPGGEMVSLGVRFLVAGHGKTVTAALKRLDDDTSPPDRVVLVTDGRTELPLGPEGQKRLDHLRRRGPAFLHVQLSFEDYAALDALQAVADAARAGDVEAELPAGRLHRVAEQEVIDSFRRHGRYREHPLLRELIGEEEQVTPAAADEQDPLACVSEREVREFLAAQAALEEGVALQAVAERYADRLTAGGQHGVDASRCLPRLREVAARMAADGQLALTADEQRLSLPGRVR